MRRDTYLHRQTASMSLSMNLFACLLIISSQVGQFALCQYRWHMLTLSQIGISRLLRQLDLWGQNWELIFSVSENLAGAFCLPDTQKWDWKGTESGGEWQQQKPRGLAQWNSRLRSNLFQSGTLYITLGLSTHKRWQSYAITATVWKQALDNGAH